MIMKKQFLLKVTAFALTATVAMGLAASSHAGASDDIPMPTEHSNAFYVAQSQSIETYNALLNAFQGEARAYSIGEEVTAEYPDYYGGAYINDSGELVVLTTDASQEILDEIRTLAGTPVLTQQCDVSWQQIKDTIKLMSDHVAELKEQGTEIVEIRDDVMNGRVVVSVLNLSDNDIQNIKKITDAGYIEIQDAHSAPETYASYGGGYGICPANSTNGGTIGFAAKMGNTSGFVTAGHVAPTLNATMKSGSTTIGTVKKNSCYYNSTADAAFVQAASGVTASATLKNGGAILSAATVELPANTTIYMLGNTSGLTSGKVMSTSASVELGGDLYTDLAIGTYKCAPGDSGAPVMVFEGNYGGQSKYMISGIATGGGSGSSEGYGFSYYSKYTNIADELGITAITG